MKKIGFIGLGSLGMAIAETFIESGFEVFVWNRTREKAKQLLAKGAVWVERPELVCQHGLVASCLADDQAIEETILENISFFDHLGPNGLHFSMSSISPTLAACLAEKHTEWNNHYIAAPVMGRPDAVRARQHSFLLSGQKNILTQSEAILCRTNAKMVVFGDTPEAAHTAKLAINFMVASAIQTMAEAFVFCERAGISPRQLHNLISNTAFNCPLYQHYGQQMLDRGYKDPLFRLVLGAKDMTLAVRAAEEANVSVRLAEALSKRFLDAVDHGFGGLDWTGVIEEVELQSPSASKKAPPDGQGFSFCI